MDNTEKKKKKTSVNEMENQKAKTKKGENLAIGPDIHPNCDAGDQPTLESPIPTVCVIIQSPGSLLHRPPVATSDNSDSRTKAASHVHSGQR